MGEGSPYRTVGLSAAQREAIGRAELTRVEALCRHHGVPLHSWLGGAVRPRVPYAITMPLDAMSAVPPDVRRVALVSTEHDPARLIALLGAAANTLGPVVELALHLDAQLAPNALGMLREVGRRLKLAYIADPCADLVTACRAFGRGAPPLAVSAHRHAPRQLAGAMRDGGVQVLLVDPVRVGGPEAVRAWSTAADLTGVELALVALDDGEPAVNQCAQLASTLRAATQPLVAAPAAGTGGHLAIDGPSGMPAITRITLHSVSVPMRQLYVSALYMRRTTERIVVELETSDGARGFGETNGTEEVAQSITRMATRLLGQNPLDRLRLRQGMAGPTVGSRNGLADWQALAGLDMALFDWAGRHFDMPIWRLLGGSSGRDFEAVAHIPALLLDEPVDRRELPRLFADPGEVARDCRSCACICATILASPRSR